MKNLEFLPAGYIQNVRRRRRNRTNAVWAVAVLVALAGLHVINENQCRMAQASLQALQDGTGDRELRQARYSALVQQRQLLESRLAMISSLDDDAPIDLIVAELTRLMPEEMALSSIMLRVEPLPGSHTGLAGQVVNTGKEQESDRVLERGSTRVTLVGLAVSDMQVGMFVGRLTGSSLFTDVRLQFSRDSELPAGAPRMFGLDFQVHRVAVDPVPTTSEPGLREGRP